MLYSTRVGPSANESRGNVIHELRAALAAGRVKGLARAESDEPASRPAAAPTRPPLSPVAFDEWASLHGSGTIG